MKKLFIILGILVISLTQKLNSQQKIYSDIIFEGNNRWIFHVPEDDRKSIWIAPWINGWWQWERAFIFNNKGEFTTYNYIYSKGHIVRSLQIPPDYVFQKYYTGSSTLKSDYKLLTLQEVEEFTKEYHHLPSIPSGKEIQEKGIDLGEMSNLLLQKIEELTLYIIEQEYKFQKQEERIKILENIIINK